MKSESLLKTKAVIKVNALITTFLTLIFSVTSAQEAIDYFTVLEGTVWQYDVYTLNNANQKIEATKCVRHDSLVGHENYSGKDAYICLTNWDMYNNTITGDYSDTVAWSFNGAVASEYSYLFTPPYNGEFLDIMIAEIRDKIVGWYDLYQFDQPVNTEYEFLKHDTSIVYNALGVMDVSTDIVTKLIGKREADEQVTTGIGTFKAKKFSYNIIITAYLHIFDEVAEIVFADFPVTHWITNDNWIVKEWRPTITSTDELEFVGINSITAPGMDRTLTGFSFPLPETVTLFSPSDKSENIPLDQQFTWRKSNYADHYHLQLATDAAFQNIVYENSNVTDTSLTVTNLNYETHYFWKVEAKNTYGTGEWSPVFEFTTVLANFLTVSTSTLSVGAEANSTSTFNITSNVGWNVSSDQTWLTVSPASGMNNGTITVTTQENTTINPRTATITISSEVLEPGTVLVTQAAGEAVLNVSLSTLTMDAVESSQSFTITSNTNWTISSDQSWLTVSLLTGSGNSEITVTASENTETSFRSALVTVSSPDAESKTVTVNQSAASATLTVSHSEISVGPNEGDNASVQIMSNTTWEISSDQNWLSINQPSGSGNATIKLTASENPFVTTREAEVTVTSSSLAAQKIKVTQTEGVAKISVSPETLDDFSPEGGTATITLTSNTSWTITSDQEWLTFDKNSGEGDATVTLTTLENSSNEQRTANISISINGETTVNITVNQSKSTVSVNSFYTDLKIYPNPFTDMIQIKSDTSLSKVTIYSAMGKKIYCREISSGGSINTCNWADGIYLIIIENDNASLLQKLIKR